MPDAQAGHEKTLTALLPAMAGADLIYGLGMLESGVTFSLSQLVMDNEIAYMVKEVVKGIALNDESMATEAIKRAGSHGNFVEIEHTFKHMREQSKPQLIDRRKRETWASAGEKDYEQRAREKALSILKNHKPEPLPAEVLSGLSSIVRQAEKELLEKKQ
ncbi:MAG: trimethylamine methyltransferase family protein [Spirochaetota bacterium]|nr:MAG: trimethylamine methyltransferase family protein [Spirochaetota bacterium]